MLSPDQERVNGGPPLDASNTSFRRKLGNTSFNGQLKEIPGTKSMQAIIQSAVQANTLATRQRDGRASVQQHLQLYIEDLLTVAAGTRDDKSPEESDAEKKAAALEKADAVEANENKLATIEEVAVEVEAPIGLDDTLQGIEYLLTNTIEKCKLKNLDLEICQSLACTLLHCAQRCHGGGFRQKMPTKQAELALHMILGFLEVIEEFEDVLEAFTPGELRRLLKLHRHFRSENGTHRDEVLRLLLTLSQNVPQFKDWKVLVEQEAHDMFTEALKTIHFDKTKLKKSSKAQDRLPPKGLYFDTAGEKLAEMFQVDPSKGLSNSEVERRIKIYGSNSLPPPVETTAFEILVKQFQDFIVGILVLAAVVSGAIGDIKAMVVLFIVIIINATIGFWEEYKAEQSVRALKCVNVSLATVIRNGGAQEAVPSDGLVPGDIVIVNEGESVPADMRMLECNQLDIVEALLTGESDAITKSTAPIRSHKRVPVGDRINMVCFIKGY